MGVAEGRAGRDMTICRVDVVPDGPVLVRGAGTVVDDEGHDHAVRRPVVAVCVCGFTQRAPWCDGTHKVAQHNPPD